MASQALSVWLEALADAPGVDEARAALEGAGMRVRAEWCLPGAAADETPRADPGSDGVESEPSDVHLVLLMAGADGPTARERCAGIVRAHPEIPVLFVGQGPEFANWTEAEESEPFETLPSSVAAESLPAQVRLVRRRWSRFAKLKQQAIDLQRIEKTAQLAHFDLEMASGQMRASESLRRLLGLEQVQVKMTLDQLIGSVVPEDRTSLCSTLEEASESGTPFLAYFRLLDCRGEERHFRARGEGCGSSTHRLFCVLDDVTSHRDELSIAIRQSRIDPLTGLGNRRFFTERLEEALERARLEDRNLALLYLDIDRFKVVNDSLGHDAGDQLLRVVAARLLDCVRAEDLVCRGRSDGEARVTVSRLGGDEYTILLTDLSCPEDAEDVARRIHRALDAPIAIGDHSLMASTSVGIAIFPTDAKTQRELLKRADSALYEAKRAGGGSYRAFAAPMEEEALRRLRIEAGLRKALERDELALHYQPRLDMEQRKVVGVEALFRWTSDELGKVSPAAAIHVAEESGLISRLGRWVLDRACRDAAAWGEVIDDPPFLSVNVSPAQFLRDDVREAVVASLIESGLPPERLELEITESLLLDEDPRTVGAIHELRSMGIRIALDDFGTGYSSLSLLARYPIDTLKLDRDLVTHAAPDSAGGLLLTNVLRLARDLKLHPVAEGVTYQDQVAFLLERGCSEMQGFLFSRALPNDELRTLLAERRLPRPDH